MLFMKHRNDASAHHAKYTNDDAVNAMGLKSDTNPLHHDKTIINLDACHVYNWTRSGVTIPNGSISLLDFDNDNSPYNDAIEEYDYGDIYQHTASERITIKKSGLYMVTARIYWSGNSNGTFRGLYIYKNGSFVSGEAPPPLNNLPFHQSIILQLKLDVGDYITMSCYQNSGSNLDVSYGWYFEGLWVVCLKSV